MDTYINHNGRRYYLTNAGFGAHPFAWVDEFGNTAIIYGDYSWASDSLALAAASRDGFNFHSLVADAIAA